MFTSSDQDVIEGDETTFQCESKNANPTSVIKWFIDDMEQLSGIVQENDTANKIEISTFTFTPQRTQTNVKCKAFQLENKHEWPSDTKEINVLCE